MTPFEAFIDPLTDIVIAKNVCKTFDTFEALKPLFPVFLSYILSFTMILIYWNNHHHLFQSIDGVNGAVLLANGHLLFWLSLVPFVTGWMGENHFTSAPVFAFGFVLFFLIFFYSSLLFVFFRPLPALITFYAISLALLLLTPPPILPLFFPPYLLPHPHCLLTHPASYI